MQEFKGKRILILGGTFASLDLVKVAHSMGAYIIVTDDSDTEKRVAKQIADECWKISTADVDALAKKVITENIDGVFCGPSEFNIDKMIRICEKAGIRCYANTELWQKCSDKKSFKNYCIKNGVPTATEYKIDAFKVDGSDDGVEYPVIVKPVDGSSSKGISICYNRSDVLKAYDYALEWSVCKQVVIEQYIDNGGRIFSFRYVLDNGNYYPYLTFDTYIVDPINKKYLISALTYVPSSLTETFLRDVDGPVRKMFADMGLKNGVAFIQAIPYKGKIYCHEMGYRLSGGMVYKITEPMIGINDMKMMVRYALGGDIITSEEIDNIQKNFGKDNMVMAQLMLPLDVGEIASIKGLDEIKVMESVVDFLQYYYEGDKIAPQVMGTLGQHFGRITLRAESKEKLVDSINNIQNVLSVTDPSGVELYTLRFDTNRLLESELL